MGETAVFARRHSIRTSFCVMQRTSQVLVFLLTVALLIAGLGQSANGQDDGPTLEISGDDITVTETDDGDIYTVETAGTYDIVVDGSGYSVPIFLLPCPGAEGSAEAMIDADVTAMCDIGNLTPAAPDDDGMFTVEVMKVEVEGCGLVFAGGDAAGTEAAVAVISVANPEDGLECETAGGAEAMTDAEDGDAEEVSGPTIVISGDDGSIEEYDDGNYYTVAEAGTYDITVEASGYTVDVFVLPCPGANGSLQTLAEGDVLALCDLDNLAPGSPDADGQFTVALSGLEVDGCGLAIGAGDAAGTEVTASLIRIAGAACDAGQTVTIGGDDIVVGDDGSFAVAEAGTYDITLTGSGYSVDVFVLPCPGAAGSLVALTEGDGTSLCDLGSLTPGSPDADGNFTVELTDVEIDGCGLVFAAADAAQTEAGAQVIRVLNPDPDVECEVSAASASAGYGNDDLARTGVGSAEVAIIAMTVLLGGGIISTEARRMRV